MKSSNMNILITDDKDQRRMNMSALFREFATVYRYNFESEQIESDHKEAGLWKAIKKLPEFSLHLLHAGNRKQKDVIPCQHRIWYGGYGHSDTRVWENEPVIIERIDNDNTLRRKDAFALIEYVQGIGPCPSFIKSPTPKDISLDRRSDFFDLLSMPSEFDWTAPLPKDLFTDLESFWDKFKIAALQMLKKQPNLSPLDKEYLQYSKILTELHKHTIEDVY